jgi:adenylate cyclase, class 2
MNTGRAFCSRDRGNHQPRTRVTNRLCCHARALATGFLCGLRVKPFDVTHRAARLLYTSCVRQPRKTNREIEIKLRIADIPASLRKIRALGAQSQGRLLEQNTLYDTPQSDLRRRGMLLRLRVETPAEHNAHANRRERVILTAKAPPHQPLMNKRSHKRPRYKERAERELVVATSSRRWVAALTALGFRPAFRYDKYRTTFHLPSLHLDLDETPVGSILELEGSPQAIDRAARKLGFTTNAYLRATYWDLYAADCRRRGVRSKNMLFRAK